jgi:predicted nucleic acid-binding protein
VSLVDDQVIDRTRVHGPRQVTDAYLLALAVGRGGRLVTFGRSVVLSAVSGATPAHLTVL